jgi:ribosomal protein L11 methyltransferase
VSEATEPRYVEYALTVKSSDVDVVIARLQERGIEYAWIDAPIETFVTPDGYGFEEVETDKTTVRAYEEVDAAVELTPEKLDELRQTISEWVGTMAEQVEAVVPEPVTADPVYEFTAVQVREGLMIRLPWDEEREAGERTLIIEPSAAFGTGMHPTTRHCLELIDEVVEAGHNVADLGAGSGILSLLARMKGADKVIAVDLNPSAESAIQYHMELNGISDIEIVIGDVFTEFADTTNFFDLVAVNIGGKEAMELSPICSQIVKQNGYLLLSGIVEWIEEDVTTHYAGLGYGITARRQGDEWVTLLLKRD